MYIALRLFSFFAFFFSVMSVTLAAQHNQQQQQHHHKVPPKAPPKKQITPAAKKPVPAKHVKPIHPPKQVKPVKPIHPAKPVKPIHPVKPVHPAKPHHSHPHPHHHHGVVPGVVVEEVVAPVVVVEQAPPPVVVIPQQQAPVTVQQSAPQVVMPAAPSKPAQPCVIKGKPDRIETILRYLFNSVLYDSKAKKFDTALLVRLKASASIHKNVIDRLIDFYATQPLEKIMSSDEGMIAAWDKIMVDLNALKSSQSWWDYLKSLFGPTLDAGRIRYMHEPVELDSGLINFVRILYTLGGIELTPPPAATEEATKWIVDRFSHFLKVLDSSKAYTVELARDESTAKNPLNEIYGGISIKIRPQTGSDLLFQYKAEPF